jgi:hypothetical protein
MVEKATARYLTDEQAIRIGIADILSILSGDDVTSDQKASAREHVQLAVKALRGQVVA